MAKLTQAYLRKLIKESIYDLQDEVDEIGAKETDATYGHESDLMALQEYIDEAMYALEESEIESAMEALKQAERAVQKALGHAIDTHSAASHKASTMQGAAYRAGMPSASSEFGTTRSMDESRKRRMTPKRR